MASFEDFIFYREFARENPYLSIVQKIIKAGEQLPLLHRMILEHGLWAVLTTNTFEEIKVFGSTYGQKDSSDSAILFHITQGSLLMELNKISQQIEPPLAPLFIDLLIKIWALNPSELDDDSEDRLLISYKKRDGQPLSVEDLDDIEQAIETLGKIGKEVQSFILNWCRTELESSSSEYHLIENVAYAMQGDFMNKLLGAGGASLTLQWAAAGVKDEY